MILRRLLELLLGLRLVVLWVIDSVSLLLEVWMLLLRRLEMFIVIVAEVKVLADVSADVSFLIWSLLLA